MLSLADVKRRHFSSGLPKFYGQVEFSLETQRLSSKETVFNWKTHMQLELVWSLGRLTDPTYPSTIVAGKVALSHGFFGL